MKLTPITEAEFATQVIQLAQLHGWMVAHFRPARTAKGWRTAVQGDGKGFPDLVLAKAGRPLHFAELKVGKGKLTADQCKWIDCLDCVANENIAHIWHPDDWNELGRIITS